MPAQKKALFKETATQARASKADQTTEIARQIAEKEARDRAAKTEKLRALRLEKEAEEAAQAEKEAEKPAAKKAPARKKSAAREPA